MRDETAETDGVVILGAGFGGLEAAKLLGRRGVRVTLVDRQNHHLFQPLLYQVATGALSPADIAEPARRILRGLDSVTVLLGDVVGIDVARRDVRLGHGAALRFDHLVLATGSQAGYFGHDEWGRHALGLKTIADARDIRSRLLLAFELAERARTAEEREALLRFVIVGGGPTGVEMAGSIAELSRFALARDFRNIRPESAVITLVEAGPRLLPGFAGTLSDHAERRLAALGVQLRLDTSVTDIDETGVTTDDGHLPARVVVWAAGVEASGVGAMLGVDTDRGGRVPVDATLRVKGLENVYAIGDVARFEEGDAPLPGLAQVAKQQGKHLGDGLAAHIREHRPLPPFAYRGKGKTAIVGRNSAVFETASMRLTGWFAWLLWAIVHVYLLSGLQNRMAVSIHWLWRYLTYQRAAQLIAEDAHTHSDDESPLEKARQGERAL